MGGGAPLISSSAGGATSRTVLAVVLQTTPPLVLAAPDGSRLLGMDDPPLASRDAAVAAARGWLASITRGRLQGTPECFLAGQLCRGATTDRVVVCPLRSVPTGFPDLVITDPARAPRGQLRQPMAWLPLAALARTPLYDHAALTVARLATFQRPARKGVGAVTAGAWAVGARPWACVQAPPRVGGPGWGRPFAEGVRRNDSADARMREALLSVPESDPYHSHLRSMVDSIHPLDPSEVPAAYRDGELPS